VLFRHAAHCGNIVAGLGAFIHDKAVRPKGDLFDELRGLKGALRIRDAFAWRRNDGGPPAHSRSSSLFGFSRVV
jgi:hypothetical protein